MQDPSEAEFPQPLASENTGLATGPLEYRPISLAPAYRLFDAPAVAIATLFGSPIAGGLVLAINYSRLGDRRRAIQWIINGILGTVAAVLLSFFLPDGASGGIPIALTVIAVNLAKSVQGSALAEHQRQGGKLASRWAAFGIGVAVLVVLVGLAFAVVLGMTNFTK